MKLRLKVIFILASIWVLVAVAIFLYSKSVLTEEYLRLEQKEVAADLDQTTNTLKSLFSSLKLLNSDWAQWDDAYQFMRDKNDNFIKSNLAFTSFSNAKINLILFFDTNNQLLFGKNYDLTKNQFVPLPDNLVQDIQSKFLPSLPNMTQGQLGILHTLQSYVVLSGLPILNSEAKGPARGTLVMGYFFDKKRIEQLSKIVNTQVEFMSLPLQAPNPTISKAYDTLVAGAPHYIVPISEKQIYGYALIKDIDNHPIALLRIETSRELYNQGINTINQYIIITVAMGALFLIAIWFLLTHFVLDRLIKVSRQVIEIKNQNKFTDKLEHQGKDELGELVEAINSLMVIIAISQEQLKHRIQLRTEELEQLAQVNKNMYSEMSQQKEVEQQLREGEKILRHMAYYDALTGLPNRIYFHELLQNKIAKAERVGNRFVLFFLDADKFKTINDSHGHAIGDRFLQHIAQQLQLVIKDSDIAARLSGDEFMLVFDNIIDRQAISEIAEKILQRVSVPLKVNGLELKSTFSIGICIFPNDGKTIEGLERHADLAMYHAKKQPGMVYCYYQDIASDLPITNE